MNTWEMGRIAHKCEAKMGLNVRVEEDFDRVQEILDGLQKQWLSPILDPQTNDFTPKNCFWLVAEDESGPVLAGGVRVDDIEGMNIETFWSRALTRAFGTLPHAMPSMRTPSLSGRVAYFGDLFSRSGTKLSRAMHLRLRLFTGIGHYLTYQMLKPDVTYCFLLEKDVLRGANSTYGFLEVKPFLYTWEKDPYPVGCPEWIGVLRREETEDLLSSLDRAIAEEVRSRQE